MRSLLMKRRVVITGVGVVAPGGVGKEKFWSRVKEGRPAAGPLTRFESDGLPVKIAAEAADFDPREFLSQRWMSRTERYTQFALAASILAAGDAGLVLEGAATRRAGVFEGTSAGSLSAIFDQHRKFLANGSRPVDPTDLVRGMSGNASGSIALFFHLNGPAVTFSQGCVSSSYAIHYGFRKIQTGELEVAFVGGAEAPISKELFALLSSVRLLSTQNDDPPSACKPFDARRDGIVVGEGGAILILEELNRALKRGAPIYAEVAGVGETTDAYHPTAPEPEGEMIAEAMRRALAEAGLEAEEVDYLNAHGSATRLNDVVETKAIKKAFGASAQKLPVSSTKATTGHLLGACGALELAACALAMKEGWLPPTANFEVADPSCDLDYIPRRGRAARIRAAMSNTFSFGGRNASVVIKAFTHNQKGG
ncbi:MAG: beta-ketoacyl-[acyl-carrier-protein] synthase family protein [candidate division Zixibacteria bacterium]|nr:beta-ketoacyl-[acyl-carrier-protein] synthase family protein [candidate division Zixibacteria bacterium]